MLINPNKAIEQGWIKFPDWMTAEQRKNCIQPNAIDVTADALKQLQLFTSEGKIAHVSETFGKEFPTLAEAVDVTGAWVLQCGQVYDVSSDFYVEVPEGVAAELIIRSTLNRMGLALNAGLWDSGFKGHLGAVIHVRAGSVLLEKHTRVCQIKFYESDSSGIYAGGYNTEQGKHWTEKQGVSK